MTSDLPAIPGFDGYAIDKLGDVWSYWGRGAARGFDYSREPRRLRPGLSSKGRYRNVTLARPGRSPITRDVHPLVCLTYHGEAPGPGFVASHLNGDSHDNRPENLAWESQAENLRRRIEHGTDDRGVRNTRALLTEDQVAEVWRLLMSGEYTHAEIGVRFGVSRTFITKIATGYRYPGTKPERSAA